MNVSLTERNLLLWEGISVKSEKLRGFSAKMRDHAGLTGIDPGWLDLIPWI
jgi:hypothetical protein